MSPGFKFQIKPNSIQAKVFFINSTSLFTCLATDDFFCSRIDHMTELHRRLAEHDQDIRPRKGTAATPMAFVGAILAAYERRQLDPSKLLKSIGITRNDAINFHAYITASQMECISGAAMQELGDEALGWFSRRLPWGSYGMLARASISSPNLAVAIKRWCRHHGLLTEDILLTLTTSDQTACIRISERVDLGTMREFCLVSVLRNMHGFACWLVDSRIPIKTAQFPFTAPHHQQAYSILFTRSTIFKQKEASIYFDSSYLDLPVLRDETALQQMLQRALPLTVYQYKRDRLLMLRVKQILARCLQNQLHTADSLAHALNMSPRTLHRQLKSEGTSLQLLKNDVRLKRATAMLLQSNRPLKQIAIDCGFLDEKSFMRTFKNWTGMTPGDYRDERSVKT